jgi:hypothetical protein
MENMKKTKNLLLALTTGALVTTTATACTSDDTTVSPTESASSTPTSEPTPLPTPTSTPMSAVTPGEEFDQDEANLWAAGVTSSIDPASILAGHSGHLGSESAEKFTFTDTQLEAGTYSYSFACRGEGDIVLTIENAGAPVTTIEGPCTGELQSGSFTLTEATTDFVAVSTEEPIDYLVRVTAALPS